MTSDLVYLTEHVTDSLRRARVRRRLYAEVQREEHDAGPMTWDELLHAAIRLEHDDEPGAWPAEPIERAGRTRTLEGLERLADTEANAIARYYRYLDRVSLHRRRRPGCSCLAVNFWRYITEMDGYDEDHFWTLRILRRARSARRSLDSVDRRRLGDAEPVVSRSALTRRAPREVPDRGQGAKHRPAP